MKPFSNAKNIKQKVNFSYQKQNAVQMNPNVVNQIPTDMMNCNYEGAEMFGFGQSVDNELKLFNSKEEDKDKKVVAIIISFVAGSSFDELFTTEEQKSMEGTKVLVYSAGAGYIEKMIQAFSGDPQDDVAKQMMEHVNTLDPDCVVFNWECSSSYQSRTFPEGKDHVFKFLKMILDRKHMAMFSDFSLKALINEWNPDMLGPNPFRNIGQTWQPFQLHFKPDELKESPSAQLQIVGEMAEGGKCNVSCMPSTILYSVDQHVKYEGFYDLKVLTVATNVKVKEDNLKCKIEDKSGSAGHVALTYKSGGHLLTSMGHWIELMKIDTSEKKLFEIAERQYGVEKAQEMKMEYNQMGFEAQKEYVSKNAVKFVQSSAPCNNMATKKFKGPAKKY